MKPYFKIGGITSDEEEALLEAVNEWVSAHGLPRGEIAFDYSDPETGRQKAVFDLVWASELHPGLSAPVALLLKEGEDTLDVLREIMCQLRAA